MLVADFGVGHLHGSPASRPTLPLDAPGRHLVLADLGLGQVLHDANQGYPLEGGDTGGQQAALRQGRRSHH